MYQSITRLDIRITDHSQEEKLDSCSIYLLGFLYFVVRWHEFLSIIIYQPKARPLIIATSLDCANINIIHMHEKFTLGYIAFTLSCYEIIY